MEWTLQITYGVKPFKLRAELEYHSDQIMRIRVHGSKSSLLLENNYPAQRMGKSKRAIQWKIREGSMTEGNKQNTSLLLNITDQLEYIIKHEFPVSLSGR
jgi:hypothetical protein